MTALAMPDCARGEGSVVPSMFTVRIFLMRDGYSDGSEMWDNVKLFMRTEEKLADTDNKNRCGRMKMNA